MKSFSQMGMRFDAKNGEFRSVLFEVRVSSDYHGKTISVADVETGVEYTLPADLVAFWFEHGTDEAKSMVKSRYKIIRPPIPYEYIDRFIKAKNLTVTNAAMALTGSYSAETIRQWKRIGHVKRSNPHYERIAELTGFDPYDGDESMNFIGGDNDFLRLPGSVQKNAKS